MPEIMVKAENVHKTYATGTLKVNALQGIDLQVNQGELVAIMGPSGCGKTTLLNCLSGIDGINNGNIEIGGKPIQKLSDNALSDFRAHFMGFVFQTYNLLPVLTAQENVELPLLISGYSQKAAKVKALESLSAVNLADWSGHRPSELSGGQQQRVSLARALVVNPEIMLFDEPLSNLDAKLREEMRTELLEIQERVKITSIYVTHDQDEALVLADRVAVMNEGRIEQVGTPA